MINKKLNVFETYKPYNVYISTIETNNDGSQTLNIRIDKGVNDYKVLVTYYTEKAIIEALQENKAPKKYLVIKTDIDNVSIEPNYKLLKEDKYIIKGIYFYNGRVSKSKNKEYRTLEYNLELDALDNQESEENYTRQDNQKVLQIK